MNHVNNRAERLAAAKRDKLIRNEKKERAQLRASRLRRKRYVEEEKARETEDELRAAHRGVIQG